MAYPERNIPISPYYMSLYGIEQFFCNIISLGNFL